MLRQNLSKKRKEEMRLQISERARCGWRPEALALVRFHLHPGRFGILRAIARWSKEFVKKSVTHGYKCPDYDCIEKQEDYHAI